MKNFINRPIPRLLRYELLLKNILEETPDGHEDLDTIPAVLEAIKALGKETEPGVVSAKQKVEVWRYNSNLVFKQGEAIVGLLHIMVLCIAHASPPSGYGPAERESILDSHWKAPASAGYWLRMEQLDGTFRALV